MTAFLAGFLRPFATPLAAIGGFVAAWVILSTYNAVIENPGIIADARKGYVAEVKYETLQLQLKAQRRNREIAEAAQNNFRKQLEVARRIQAENTFRHDQEIEEYEAILNAAGRSCRLDDADIDWLRKH